jgi:cytochrome b/b6/petD-like protein
MTHGITQGQFLEMVATFLVPYYLLLALMNGLAVLYLWKTRGTTVWFRLANPMGDRRLEVTNLLGWGCVASVFFILALAAFNGGNGGNAWMPSMPASWREAINWGSGPVNYSMVTTLVLAMLFFFRSFFVKPAVAWTIWNLMFLFLGLSMTDRNFYEIVAKPDNVPIVMLAFLLPFFTWVGTSRAVDNDQRLDRGEPLLEETQNEKVLVWPDLVYIELICMVVLTAVLIVWAIGLQAPLEEPASSVKTPNPSKAPWYFLGLQEMLVYFDPWMAGVVMPLAIVLGLMAIPYLDFNQAGNGYYTIKQRKFGYLIFQFGFLEMWITLMVLGTLLRGPNWNFFGPYEPWDAHKVQALNNINLSDYFWDWMNMSLPVAAAGSADLVQLGSILLRESVGIALVLGYFIALPPLLAWTLFRQFYQRMGFIRFILMTNLLLLMAALPIKMILRWLWDLKYLIAIPEYSMNF